ncbi:MAG: protease PrsW [Crocinitomicaceae bacterium]|nr:protease PrsW [Crocinitomicaceae bacterium]
MLLFVLSIAPVLAICIFIYWKDKFDKEPKKLLLTSFFLGTLSILVTLIISYILHFIDFNEINNNKLWSLISCILGIGMVEEFSKFIFVRFYAFKRKEFNEPFDGITYSVMVAMGFAAVENTLYVYDGGESVGIMRMFTSVPAHATFGIIMGFFLGLEKINHKKNFGIIGLLLAATLHGLYDFYLMNLKFNYLYGLYWFVLFLISIYLSFKAIKIHQNHLK